MFETLKQKKPFLIAGTRCSFRYFGIRCGSGDIPLQDLLREFDSLPSAAGQGSDGSAADQRFGSVPGRLVDSSLLSTVLPQGCCCFFFVSKLACRLRGNSRACFQKYMHVETVCAVAVASGRCGAFILGVFVFACKPVEQGKDCVF